MKVFYAQSPDNHHYFLKTLDNNSSGASLLRFDYHRDDLPFKEINCATYVYDLLSNNNFFNIIWINKLKKDTFIVSDYSSDCYEPFKSINDLLDYVNSRLQRDIILDIDPDVTLNYPVTYLSGFMTKHELSSIIKSVNESHKIKYCFFASDKNFAKKILKKSGIKELEFEFTFS